MRGSDFVGCRKSSLFCSYLALLLSLRPRLSLSLTSSDLLASHGG